MHAARAVSIDRKRRRAPSPEPDPDPSPHRRPRAPEFRPYASLADAVLAGDAPAACAIGLARPEAWRERGCAAAYVAGYMHLSVEGSLPPGEPSEVYRAARAASAQHCAGYLARRADLDLPYVC